jgi:hypothetical protein
VEYGEQGRKIDPILGIGPKLKYLRTLRTRRGAALLGRARRDCDDCSRGGTIRKKRHRRRCAKTAIGHNPQRVPAGNGAHREARVVTQNRPDSDHDRIVVSAQLMGKAERFGGADPLRTAGHSC